MSYDLHLYSRDLLSKWGFNDGDEPDALLDALDDAGLPHPVGWHGVLRRLVRAHLVPALAEHHEVEVYDIKTSHNPIRASKVDGVEIDGYALDHEVTLTPDEVVVPWATLLAELQADR